MSQEVETLEVQLNSFDLCTRMDALESLFNMALAGEITPDKPTKSFNLHSHTFFSYNGYNLSPTALAWRAWKEGLYALGIVDFDVLDGVDEFLGACDLLGLRGTCGLETRVFVPEFADQVINSPGEPGVAYHMGLGFSEKTASCAELLETLNTTAQKRNQNMLKKVNSFLAPVILEYEADVLPLTPSGNATERHICMAYDAKARVHFNTSEALSAFWAEKLGQDTDKIAGVLEDAPTLQGLIRAKTMKQGGVGYVAPERGDFPEAKVVNAFTRSNHAIPTLAWLDGASEGEHAIGELLELMMADGVAAVNVIPDRNWNIADAVVKAKKVAAMDHFVELASGKGLPVIIGTEMNAFGQRFVDDFSAPEMKKHEEVFLASAHILHGHTVLQRFGGRGYLSAWAEGHFPKVGVKNAFYAAVGASVAQPDAAQRDKLRESDTPEQVSAVLGLRMQKS